VTNQAGNDPTTGAFIPPPPGNLGTADVGALLRNTLFNVDTDPASQNQPQVIDLARLTGNKSYAGCSYVRLPLSDNRSGHSQTGKYSAVNVKRASGGLIVDDPGYLRLPFMTTAQATNPPAAIDRMVAARFQSGYYFTGYETSGTNHLWRETSQTDPTEVVEATYAPIAGPSVAITCMEPIAINSTPYLAIGYAQGGFVSCLQVVSSIGPWVASSAPTGLALSIWGITQTAIDGNALLIYQDVPVGTTHSGAITALRTDVDLGAVTLSPARSTVPRGGYAVGQSGWEGDVYAYWVVPTDRPTMTFNDINFDKAAGAPRGKLIRTDLRGYLATPVDVPLRWVTFVTKVRGGLVVCDTQTHWFFDKKGYQHEERRMPLFDDLPANSDRQQTCCGHFEKNGRFFIEVNDYGTGGNTQRYWLEWDFDLWAPSQASSAKTLTTTGVQSIGGAAQAWSPFTGFLHSRADGSWWRQFQPELGVNGFNLRHTSGAAAGTGYQYELTESLTWPVMDIDGLEDQAKMLVGVIGPKPGNVIQGGPAATVLVEELLSGVIGSPPLGKGALFGTTEPTERVPRQAIKANAWTYQTQPRVTVTRDNVVTDASLMTPNAFGNDIYLEYLSIKNPLMAPAMEALKRYLDPQR
jgi:hypothetical protein